MILINDIELRRRSLKLSTYPELTGKVLAKMAGLVSPAVTYSRLINNRIKNPNKLHIDALRETLLRLEQGK